MYEILFLLIVAAFGAMLFVNIFFRVKILRSYRYLVKNRIEFNSSHFFNRNKLENEVLSKYPDHRDAIEDFIRLVKKSVSLASGLIVIILLFGYLLMKFR